MLHHVRPIEAYAELETRHPRLRHHELRRSDLQPVADTELALEYALGGQILAEGSPRKVHTRKLSEPVRIVLQGIGIHGLVDAAVHREIGLLVAVHVERAHVSAALDRGLEDGSADGLSAPLDLARRPDVQRHDPHATILSHAIRRSAMASR